MKRKGRNPASGKVPSGKSRVRQIGGKMRKFVKKHKVESIIVLVVLLLAIPFIWPFLLSILWNVGNCETSSQF